MKTTDAGDARQRIDAALSDVLTPERIETVVDRVLEARKKVSANCPSCNKAITVEVDDARAVAAALADLLKPGEGSSWRDSRGHSASS